MYWKSSNSHGITGEFQLDNYPTGVVNSYIKLGFGELLDQTGTFQIQARNI